MAAAVLQTALNDALALSSSATARSSAFALGSRRAQFMLERDRQRISKSVFTSEKLKETHQIRGLLKNYVYLSESRQEI